MQFSKDGYRGGSCQIMILGDAWEKGNKSDANFCRSKKGQNRVDVILNDP